MEVEALATTRALEFAFELGIVNAVLEGNSKVIMKALIEEEISLSSYGLLIADAKLCSNVSNQLHYSHVRKEGNKVAHNLARYAITVIWWMKAIPPPFVFVLWADLAGFS